MTDRISLHEGVDHTKETANLINNFKINNVFFFKDEYNKIENKETSYE